MALNGQPAWLASPAPTAKTPGWLAGSCTAPGALPAAARIEIPFACAWLTASVNASLWSGVGGIFDDERYDDRGDLAPATGSVHLRMPLT